MNSQFEQEPLIIELRDKMVVLKVLPFDTDINVDEILRIDHSNYLGEILTFPVLLNRVANLKAEMQNLVSEAKNDTEIFEAQLSEEYRKKISATGKATINEVDNAVKIDPRYKIKKNDYFAKVRNLDYLDSLYWACQSKMNLLNKISEKIRPDEFEKELLEDVVNGVWIKASRKVIK